MDSGAGHGTVHFNSRTWDTAAGQSLGVPYQPGLHNETLSYKQKSSEFCYILLSMRVIYSLRISENLHIHL